MNKKMLGKNNPNYTDGRTKKKEELIKQITQEQDNKCKVCKSKRYLECHRLESKLGYIHKSNLVILCKSCHSKLHQKGYNFKGKKWLLLLTEYYTCLQGEGPTTGKPSHLIRLFGCSMKCHWCDSKYSWTEKEEYDYIKVVKMLKQFRKKYPRVNDVIISGGEPLEQNITPLIILCKIFNWRVEVETNGKPKSNKELYQTEKDKLPPFVDQWNVSPKLLTKEIIRRYRKERIELFIKRNSCFKFVVKNKEELEEATKFIKSRKIPKDKVYIMPNAVTGQELKRVSLKIIDDVIKKGYNLSPRLHVWLFGKKRGV